MGEIITFDNNSPEIQYLCKKDKRLAKVISMIGPIHMRLMMKILTNFLFMKS